MAEVCTNLESTGNNSVISSHPLNLTLLGKRSVDESEENENAGDESRKRPKHDDGNSDDERVENAEQAVRDNQSDSADGDRSKCSILQHFYSFIRRKTEEGEDEVPSRPREEQSEPADGREKWPAPIHRSSPSACDRYKSLNGNFNGSERLPMTPDSSLLDYNVANNSRQFAARPIAPNFMDLWSAVAANALARAKFHGKNGRRNSPTFPGMFGVGNDHDGRRSFTTSPGSSSNSIPERTMRQNNWAVKVWRDWAIERNAHANISGKSGPYNIVPIDIKDSGVEIMSFWLPRFITEVRRRDKRAYPPDTLMQIASGLQRHLRHVSGRSDITFFDKYSPTFAEFREALKARSDAINSEMSTARGDFGQMSPHTNGGGVETWTSSLMNFNTAKGLFRAIFYYNCMNFHITSMEEHHSLQVSQFRIAYDGRTEHEYLEFTRENGEVTRKFATPYDPRCIVYVFKKYFKCIPSTGLLYKRPLQSSDGTELRFSFNPVGINKLRETFKILFGGRRTGVQLPSIGDEEDKEVFSQRSFRYSSGDEESKRALKFDYSPRSNASSERASLSDFKDESGEENRCPASNISHEVHSQEKSVIAYASERNPNPPSPTTEISMARQQTLEENNNNNSSTTDDEDSNSLTLKVPAYVKSVVILQGTKRFKVDLTGMN